MKGRLLVITALAVYASVVGCVVWPDHMPSASHGAGGGEITSARNPGSSTSGLPVDERHTRLEGLPLRGVALQIHDVNRIPDYKKAIDEIAAVGADTVELIVSTRMENGTSARIFLDIRVTPSPEKLGELIDYAQSKKLRVVLMPIVLLESPRGNDWRGTIKPDSGSGWGEWFDSYREMMFHFCTVAESRKIDLLVVGSELVSSEEHDQEWNKTIKAIRERFHGKLTYSSNWDHYNAVNFWDKLDVIGMNSYWKLGDNKDVSLEDIQKRWREIQKDLTAFSNKQGKPIILLEVGWCSLANAADEPWDYTQTEKSLDLDLQRRLYEGFFRSWFGNPILAGFMIWEWNTGEVPLNDRGYTPHNKPAEKVLMDWMAKGPWEVR